MTNPTQFLETEAALKALTEELTAIKAASESIKTASESLEGAKVSVQKLTQMSEKVIDYASVVSKNSDQLLTDFGVTQEEISTQHSAIRESLLESQEKTEAVMQKTVELSNMIEAIQGKINEISDESKKREERLSRLLTKNGWITWMFVIFCLFISTITLIVVLFPYLQKLILI